MLHAPSASHGMAMGMGGGGESGGERPRDAQAMEQLLRAHAGTHKFEPKCINLLLEFMQRHSRETLRCARDFAEHAGRVGIDAEDTELALSRAQFATPPSREIMLGLARDRNRIPLPVVPDRAGVLLPTHAFTLTSATYHVLSESESAAPADYSIVVPPAAHTATALPLLSASSSSSSSASSLSSSSFPSSSSASASSSPPASSFSSSSHPFASSSSSAVPGLHASSSPAFSTSSTIPAPSSAAAAPAHAHASASAPYPAPHHPYPPQPNHNQLSASSASYGSYAPAPAPAVSTSYPSAATGMDEAPDGEEEDDEEDEEEEE